RTLEGVAFEELSTLPQIVSGIDDASLRVASEFFKKVSKEVVELKSTEEAEMVKLLNNSERDLIFSLANEIALMCDSKGLNAHRIIGAANYRYTRSNLKYPGLVGGPCLEKDPYILTEGFYGSGYVPTLFLAGRKVNESIVKNSIEKIAGLLDNNCDGATCIGNIAVLGFAFKGRPQTGDMRGSLVRDLIVELRGHFPGAHIIGHDFLVDPVEMLSTGVEIADTVQRAISKASLIILQNNHPRYLEELKAAKMTKGTWIFDFWNQFGDGFFGEGVQYLSLGNLGFSNFD
uniref:UDP binding domain-containing protein n=1 Tax=Fulvivirga sp. TaxID=1931237 RepID=UPI00404986E1